MPLPQMVDHVSPETPSHDSIQIKSSISAQCETHSVLASGCLSAMAVWQLNEQQLAWLASRPPQLLNNSRKYVHD